MSIHREFCCLCLASVTADHRRRKIFHGESCSNARSVIRSLADEQYVELNDPLAVLCNACEKKAINIRVLSDKVEKLKLEVKSSLSRLHIDVRAAASSRKRPSLPIDTPSDPEPATKRSQTVTSQVDLTLHFSEQSSRPEESSSVSSSAAQSTSITDTAACSDTSPDIQVRFPY